MVYKAIKKEIMEPHKYCDVCGNEIRIGLVCSKAKCEYCKKDLCEKCIGHEESSPGDYRIVYCNNCWEIGEKYRPKIEQLNDEICILYKEWQDKCKV